MKVELEQRPPSAPTDEQLFNDGHFKEECPDFRGVGIFVTPTPQSVLSGQGPAPIAVVVCSCGVIKAVPLGGGRATN